MTDPTESFWVFAAQLPYHAPQTLDHMKTYIATKTSALQLCTSDYHDPRNNITEDGLVELPCMQFLKCVRTAVLKCYTLMAQILFWTPCVFASSASSFRKTLMKPGPAIVTSLYWPLS